MGQITLTVNLIKQQTDQFIDIGNSRTKQLQKILMIMISCIRQTTWSKIEFGYINTVLKTKYLLAVNLKILNLKLNMRNENSVLFTSKKWLLKNEGSDVKSEWKSWIWNHFSFLIFHSEFLYSEIIRSHLGLHVILACYPYACGIHGWDEQRQTFVY